MEIAQKVLDEIGKVFRSGVLIPDVSVVDQADKFVDCGICGLDLLDTWMAIEFAAMEQRNQLHHLVIGEYYEWSAAMINAAWDPILAALGHQKK